jgi:serine acetyltransferase
VPDHSVVAGVPARSVRRHVAGEGWVPPLPVNPEAAPADWPAS